MKKRKNCCFLASLGRAGDLLISLAKTVFKSHVSVGLQMQPHGVWSACGSHTQTEFGPLVGPTPKQIQNVCIFQCLEQSSYDIRQLPSTPMIFMLGLTYPIY